MSGNPLMNMNPMNMMQNNPIMQLINMARSGKGNPAQMIQQMAGQNHQMQQVLNMVNGKDESQIKELIANTAKERGVDLTQLGKNLNIPPEVAKRYGIPVE